MNYLFNYLENKVGVVTVPIKGVKSLAVGVFVQTGSRYETKNNNGISHFLEHMAFKGTRKFPTHVETSYLEGLGAIQNAWTDVDATAYWCKIPADKWREALELTKELALYPTIPEKDLEIERGVILEEINRRDDRPDEIVGETLMDLAFPDNPLGWTILGKPEVIKTVTKANFVDYHKQHYTSDRLVVVLAGSDEVLKRDSSEIKDSIEEWFGNVSSHNGRGFVPLKINQSQAGFKISQKDLASQAHIELAVRGLTVSDPRRFALSLLTAYMGQGLSSRLFTELREKQGLCYAVRADEARWEDTGLWSVYAGLALDKLEVAVKAILKEMRRLKTELLTSKELETTKEKVRGPLIFSAENPVNQMNFYAHQALDRPNDMMDYDMIINSLMSIDAEQIRKVANDLFITSQINLAVVGPVSKERVEKICLEL